MRGEPDERQAYERRRDAWKPPPRPADEEFVQRTLWLIQEADNGARDMAGLRHRILPGLVVEPVRTRRRRGKGSRPLRARRTGDGTCVGCGCPHDEQTPGCTNCRCRHQMRLHVKLDRICRMLIRALP